MALNYRRLLPIIPLAIALYYSQPLLTSILPFFIAFILAGSIEPAVAFLQDKARMPRGMAVFVVLVVLALLTSYSLITIITRMVAELVELGRLLPAYRLTMIEMSQQLLVKLQELHQSLPGPISENIQQGLHNFLKTSEDFARNIINRFLGAITFSANIGFMVIITFLATYFLSKDKDILTDTITSLAPPRWQSWMTMAKDRILVDLIGFIRAQVFLLMLSTIVAAVGLVLLKVRYWMTLALVIGIVDLVPAIGPGLIIFPWSAFSFLFGHHSKGLGVLVLYGVIFLMRQSLQPKLFGDAVGIHPLAMLAALYTGVVFFGLKGAFIGPILAIIAKAIWYTKSHIPLDQGEA
ncbi:MAG: sporulation integral membrane protein YtvI [Firmicutes bacterium]|nr:sporulation integral membrane protein YtvI [Bacillota bacterium]